MTILRLENIYKDFSGLQVLSGVSMDVQEQECHAIIGPNGAGKSTLFNIITGLYKPNRGEVTFLNRDITHCSIHKIARMGLSRSFQITNIFPKMTVFENLRSAVVSRFNRRLNCTSFLHRDRKILEESDKIIALIGMMEVRDVPACEMSYGMQRQLELALTLAREPILVLLDEPTAGLNAEETRSIIPLIRKVMHGKTLVIVEHDMEVVFNLANRITVLNYGQVLASGTPDDIRESEEVKKAYLGRM